MTIKLEYANDAAVVQKQLTHVAHTVLAAKRLVFVSGAGISCSAGIPDFRSLNGLYSAKQGQNATVKGKDLFDVSLFNSPDTTALFYKFMAELRRKTLVAQPTPTHRLLRTMKDRGTLLRAYTQNIDGLEARAGLNLCPAPLPQNDVLQLHGDVHTLKCFLCSELFAYNDALVSILAQGMAPECPSCADKCAIRVALGRRPIAVGTLRPDIVLYGEAHPAGEQISRACNADIKKKPDCLVIAGTSLKIPGLKRLIKDFAKTVHAQGGLVIFVNLTEAAATAEWCNVIDYHVQGTSDEFTTLLHVTRPSYFTKQVTLKHLKQRKVLPSVTKAAEKNVASKVRCTWSDSRKVSTIKICVRQQHDMEPLVQPVKKEKYGFEEDTEHVFPSKRCSTEAFPPNETISRASKRIC